MERVLVVDDDEEVCELAAEYLQPEGFQVEAVHDGEQSVQRILSGDYALVVLDVMLPGLGGFEVLRRVRAADGPGARTPVLMLTARGDEVDRIVGLEIGADDYLPKPCNPREMVARIRAILRRTRSGDTPVLPAQRHLRVGDVALDPTARVAHLAGAPLDLTSLEFDLLKILLAEAGQVVRREAISQQVFGRKLLPFDRSIDTHISNLRKKLGPHPDGMDRIKTVRGMGYVYAVSG